MVIWLYISIQMIKGSGANLELKSAVGTAHHATFIYCDRFSICVTVTIYTKRAHVSCICNIMTADYMCRRVKCIWDFEISRVGLVYTPNMHSYGRHNERDCVSNNRSVYCLLNRLFRVTGLCETNSPVPVNSSKKGPVTRKMIWWRHRVNTNVPADVLAPDCALQSASRVVTTGIRMISMIFGW